MLILNPQNFEQEYSTVWSFPYRGNWATHKNSYRGNWSPEVVRNLLFRYSKEGDYLLDPMISGGTRAIECKLLNRNSLALDINPYAIELTKEALKFESAYNPKIRVELNDARSFGILKDNSTDFILNHPPYADIIKYSDGKIKEDLSNIHDIDSFVDEMGKVAEEFYRVLKLQKYCAVLIGDTRRKKMYQPLAFKIMQKFLDIGFRLKENIIKVQHNCSTTPSWIERSKKYNFLLIMHEHLFIFQK